MRALDSLQLKFPYIIQPHRESLGELAELEARQSLDMRVTEDVQLV